MSACINLHHKGHLLKLSFKLCNCHSSFLKLCFDVPEGNCEGASTGSMSRGPAERCAQLPAGLHSLLLIGIRCSSQERKAASPSFPLSHRQVQRPLSLAQHTHGELFLFSLFFYNTSTYSLPPSFPLPLLSPHSRP